MSEVARDCTLGCILSAATNEVSTVETTIAERPTVETTIEQMDTGTEQLQALGYLS